MEIGIKVIAENIQTQVVRHANSCFFTMVAIDEERKPARVPPLELLTQDQKRRFAAAELRKQLRQEMSQRFEALRTAPANAHPA